MISVTGVTNNYILQPALLEKHATTLNWLSSTLPWKSELTAFQKMLDERAHLFPAVEDKKKIDHFQNLIIYYNGEVIIGLRKKLLDHESRLATMLETKDELDTQYFKEHDSVMDELETFAKSFSDLKTDFITFLQSSK